MRKYLKNKLIIFTLMLMGMFFVGFKKVDATAVEKRDVVFECIYSDGGLYEYAWNEYTGTWSVVRYAYNLKGVDTTANSSTGTVKFPMENLDIREPIYGEDGFYRCKSYVDVVVVNDSDDEDNPNLTTYIGFSNSKTTLLKKYFATQKWYDKIFGSKKTFDSPTNHYDLVSENYVFTDNVGEPNYISTYKRENEKEEGEVEQAISKPNYLQILTYIDGQKSLHFAQSASRISFLGEFMPIDEVLFFTDSDAKTYSGSDSKVSYYFNHKRTEVCAKNNSSDYCAGERYVFTEDDPGDPTFDTGELCTKIMPKTSQDLAKVIRWARFLIPALLIFLTTVDLAKIVMAGNIDEELPKQRKKIITRFIVIVVFFFLPIIVKLLLGTVKGSIGNGSSTTSEAEITTGDKVDAIQYIECILEMV